MMLAITVALFFYAFTGFLVGMMSLLADEVRPRTVTAIGILWPLAIVGGALWLLWRPSFPASGSPRCLAPRVR